ncbi:MAG TPA: hydantoinase B/oxoprolinase family protein [Chloroflexia bacterium]|nr:hydantoinase B/oxoprolinase family protein [Chloroflexia bacterium]
MATIKMPEFNVVDVDPVTLDIIENALRNMRFEMDAVLFRTAMSPGIREQHDEFPLVCHPDGRMVVGQFGSYVDSFLANYHGTIEPGDTYLVSDPYKVDGAVSHVNDWIILLPIFHEKELVGWSSMFGHMTDVGGKVPGSLPTDATTIFEEGVIIPPMKLYENGELNEDALNVVLSQCRLPIWNRSDLMAIVAACRTAEKRVLELVNRFGLDTYISTLDRLLDRTKKAMSQIIQMHIPENPVTFEDYIDDDGRGFGPYKLSCKMWREGDIAYFDWSGTDPQAQGSINFLMNEHMFKMFVGIYLILVYDPQILFNDGFYDLIKVNIPEGTLLKPRYPAALSCRTHALGRIFDVFAGGLSVGAPQYWPGAGFSSSPHMMYSGYDKKGDWFQLYQIGFGGVPGRPIGDGMDGHSMWPNFTNVPNEYLESYFPLRIERHETVIDSGGAGLHRGGNGIQIDYRFLEPGDISIHDDRWLTYPWGINGGKTGARSRKVLERTDGSVEILPSKCDRVRVNEGDLLHYITWGGGGWGDPLERPAENVRKDVARGLVSVEKAFRDYGVVVNPDSLEVDEAATNTRREELRVSRGEVSTYDFGPALAEIIANCKAETGLEPPKPPVFSQRGSGFGISAENVVFAGSGAGQETAAAAPASEL